MALISTNPFQVDAYIKASGGGGRKNMFAVFPSVSFGSHGQIIDILKRNGGAVNASPATAAVPTAASSLTGFVSGIQKVLQAGTEAMNVFQHAMLVETSSFPSQSVKPIDRKVRGRKANFGGNREWGDWKVKMLQTPGHTSRGYYEAWQDLFSDTESNLRPLAGLEYQKLYRDMLVLQLNTVGIPTTGQYIVGCFPTEIGAIDLDTSADDTLETCEITFSYQYAKRIPLADFGLGLLLDVAAVGGTMTY